MNEAFARVYFDGRNPVGRTVEVRQGKDVSAQMEIVGYVRDAVYASVREPIGPTIYVPMTQRRSNTLLVRTAGMVSPFQSTERAVWAMPAPTRASATALARRSDRRWL